MSTKTTTVINALVGEKMTFELANAEASKAVTGSDVISTVFQKLIDELMALVARFVSRTVEANIDSVKNVGRRENKVAKVLPHPP